MDDNNNGAGSDKKLTAYEKWELPALSSGEDKSQGESYWQQAAASTKKPAIKLPTAEEIEAIRKDAYEEGFAKGKAEGNETGLKQGLDAGKKQIDAELAKLGQIITAIETPLQQQNEEIEGVLVALVEKIAQQIVRRELSVNSDCVKELLREALEFIKTGSDTITIHLNPKDQQQVLEMLQALPEYNDKWNLKEHKNLSPGGCIVERAESSIDATIDTRFQNLVKQLYEREINQMKEVVDKPDTIPPSAFNDSDE